jgi:hypothetical protein
MRLTATFKIPTLAASVRKRLHEECTHILTEATKAYLNAVTAVVPVWGGASRATFSPLASHVEYALAIFPVAPHNTISLGIAESTATWVAGPITYSFTYNTTLIQLNVNEYYNATGWGFHLITPGPYHFQERGRNAFLEALHEFTMPELEYDIRTVTI